MSLRYFLWIFVIKSEKAELKDNDVEQNWGMDRIENDCIRRYFGRQIRGNQTETVWTDNEKKSVNRC